MDLERVRKNGNDLQYVKEQTEEICLTAVRQCGLSLRFVKNKTREMCIEAIKQDPFAIQFIEDQTEELSWLAIRQNIWVLGYINNPTEEMSLEVVRENGAALGAVLWQNQTLEMCKISVTNPIYDTSVIAYEIGDPRRLQYIADSEMKEICRSYLDVRFLITKSAKK